ncbi:unnamed protein product [Adineta steineri]|uniref:Apple domain-containing protein n=1 Tax=Adineta steineri TaxID=433720 RepID=A0A819JX75_9BILA|nr:unnamed protein product [Adineta steineri]CAF3934775.1 unnamed protein product [Adineta steineri]
MASRRICLWLLFMIIAQVVGEDTQSMIMSLMVDSKFQCANTTCIPFINVFTSNIMNCQVACLTQSRCRAATFHRSTSNCELFDNILSQNESILADVDATSMNVISGTRFPSVCSLSSQSSWSQNATTIFGSQAGTSGSNLTLLYDPIGMYYDGPNNMLIVADSGNQRILRFSLDNPLSVATVIAGSNGYGCNMNQFQGLYGIGVDSSGQSYVTDFFCNQIVRFPSNSNSTTFGTLLGSIALAASISINQLTNDTYVVSNNDNAVYKFVGGNGPAVVAAGGNGNGNALNQLSGPVGVYYDYLYTNSLYVADSNNNRVLKFPSGSTNATYGTVVAGDNGAGTGANQLNNPRSIIVDSSGTLYIADTYNNRIQRWLQNATSGITIVGGIQGTASDQLYFPETVLFDKYEPTWDKWKQNAITVAGGNGQGQELNQLNGPVGIFIDKKKNIFIADWMNHRIVQWEYNAKEGHIIADRNQMQQLDLPTDVIVDQQNHSIIIADQGNRRVIQYSNQTQQILIDNIDCCGLAMDKYGFLYVSDGKKNEVRRWKMGEYNNEGIVVAGGNGQGNQLNQLNYPTFIFVDENQSIYVSDWNNHRVMKWRKDVKEGKVVVGGNGRGENLNQLWFPRGVFVDHLGQIYVADYGNHRVVRWCEGKEKGEIIVGGNDERNQLKYPRGLSFDDEGNLYVTESFNHRIIKFEIIL